jgi:hypothetical protein
MLVQPAFATEATCRVFAGDVDRGAQTVRPPAEAPELVAQIAEPEVCRIVERLFLIEVVSFDWNCPQYITPRYTAEEAQSLVAPLKQRIAELEAQLTGVFLRARGQLPQHQRRRQQAQDSSNCVKLAPANE